MHDLLSTTNLNDQELSGSNGSERAKEMYSFVVEDLSRLEARLLEIVEEAEMKANGGEKESFDGIQRSNTGVTMQDKGWTIVPRGVRGKTDIAMSWLPVRAKALELVRQRDALGSRVLFAQMSMISS